MELSESYTIWKVPDSYVSVKVLASLEYLSAVKHKVVSLDYDQGGLLAPRIYVLAWISRGLADEHKSRES